VKRRVGRLCQGRGQGLHSRKRAGGDRRSIKKVSYYVGWGYVFRRGKECTKKPNKTGGGGGWGCSGGRISIPWRECGPYSRIRGRGETNMISPAWALAKG